MRLGMSDVARLSSGELLTHLGELSQFGAALFPEALPARGPLTRARVRVDLRKYRGK